MQRKKLIFIIILVVGVILATTVYFLLTHTPKDTNNEKVNEKVNEEKTSEKVTEEKIEVVPLYFNSKTNRVVLSSGKETEFNSKYEGIPTLINFTPEEIQKRFTESFSKIDADIIKMINEIEYSPTKSPEGVTIDADRFLLKMTDGNLVYVSILNMNRLNNYKNICATLTAKGTLLLDNAGDASFVPFENQDEPKGDEG